MAASIQPPPGFEYLPIEEKIAYVQALWDLIAANPEDVPLPDWHRAVIEERLAEARSGKVKARPWPAVRAELHARLRGVHE